MQLSFTRATCPAHSLLPRLISLATEIVEMQHFCFPDPISPISPATVNSRPVPRLGTKF